MSHNEWDPISPGLEIRPGSLALKPSLSSTEGGLCSVNVHEEPLCAQQVSLALKLAILILNHRKNVKRKWLKKNDMIFERYMVLSGGESSWPFSPTHCASDFKQVTSPLPVVFLNWKMRGLPYTPGCCPHMLHSPAVWPEIRVLSPGSGTCRRISCSHAPAPGSAVQVLGYFVPSSCPAISFPREALSFFLHPAWAVTLTVEAANRGHVTESCFLAHGLQLAQEFNKNCSLPVFTTAEPGAQEYNLETAQFNQVKTTEFRGGVMLSLWGSPDAVTLFMKMIENVFLNRIETPCIYQTTVLALMSWSEVFQLLVHGCFSTEVPYYCWEQLYE